MNPDPTRERCSGSAPCRRRLLVAAAALLGVPGARAQRPAAALPAPAPLAAGHVLELRVALPDVLHGLAGPVRVARVQAVVPPRFDARRAAPVLVVSATSDAGLSSSRRLLQVYRDAASAAGWVTLAADPDAPVPVADDTLSMRFALVRTALAALRQRWPGGGAAPLGFAGFSGGSKYAGWLAALHAQQRERLAGLFLAGLNEEVVAEPAHRLGVLDDAYREVPVALQVGRADEVSTPDQHHAVLSALGEAGFRSVRLELIDGPHVPDAATLPDALAWFAERWRERHGRDLIEA